MKVIVVVQLLQLKVWKNILDYLMWSQNVSLGLAEVILVKQKSVWMQTQWPAAGTRHHR